MKFARANLLSPEEFCEIFGVKVKTLTDWRLRKYGPPYYKAGRRVWYRKDDVDAWMESTGKGKRNGFEGSAREVALPVRARRKRVHGKHRFGRHRTKQEACGDSRIGVTASSIGGPAPQPQDQDLPLRGSRKTVPDVDGD